MAEVGSRMHVCEAFSPIGAQTHRFWIRYSYAKPKMVLRFPYMRGNTRKRGPRAEGARRVLSNSQVAPR